jgi:long-chain acyl-CoA synthetase
LLITDPIEKNARLYPKKSAIEMEDQKVTYTELLENIRRIGAFFSHEPKKGLQGVAALFVPNGIPFLEFFLGAASKGWIAVPLDLKWKQNELTERLNQAKPDVIITTKEYKDRLSLWEGKVVLDKDVPLYTPIEAQTASEDSLFYMGFTSGSTGVPKCFVRNHRSWVKSFACSKEEFGLTDRDTVLVPGPLVHSLFLYAAISTLFLGGTVKLLSKFSAVKTLNVVQAKQATALYAVPTMLAALLKEMESAGTIPSLKKIISSGAKWEPGLKDRIQQYFQETDLLEFYGASELSFVSYINHRSAVRKPLSVGRPFHNVKLSIRDKDGNEVGLNDVGTLYVKSDMLFSHYINRPDANKEVWSDGGWLTVGDLAKVDEDGDLYIIGRSNNMIISGGQNVYPEEIEKVLNMMEGVDEAIVFGTPDPYWGQKISAAILVEEDILTVRDVQRFCRKHLSVFKVPKQVIFTKELPYTSSGKIARAQVKEMYSQGVYTP